MKDEALYGGGPFTVGQAEALKQLECEGQLKEMLRNLGDYYYPAQYVICRVAKSLELVEQER